MLLARLQVKTGRVYIVGAGPGDPELITLKALKVLQEADVVLYDRLIPKKLLDYAPPHAEKIYVGKEPGKHTLTQEQIIQLMIEKAKQGKTVVRLHGGDPFLFGRGFEEYRELIRHNIPCEVIPGITSAIAVPERYNIPLVLRGYASSVAIVTGTEDPKKQRKFVDLKTIARAVDTIVILMGAHKLKQIHDELRQAELPEDTPVAILRAYIEPELKIITTLKELPNINVDPPVVIIIGNVLKAYLELNSNGKGTITTS